MSKELYQSLQSSLPRADKAPFSDYSSSISDILTQVSNLLVIYNCASDLISLKPPRYLLKACWKLSIPKHHLSMSHVGVNIILWIEFSINCRLSYVGTGD